MQLKKLKLKLVHLILQQVLMALGSRCLDLFTQNPNESLNNLIWASCPKKIYQGLRVVELCTASALAYFNDGASSIARVLDRLNVCPGKSTNVAIEHFDRQRIRSGEKKSLKGDNHPKTPIEATNYRNSTSDDEFEDSILVEPTKSLRSVKQKSHNLSIKVEEEVESLDKTGKSAEVSLSNLEAASDDTNVNDATHCKTLLNILLYSNPPTWVYMSDSGEWQRPKPFIIQLQEENKVQLIREEEAGYTILNTKLPILAISSESKMCTTYLTRAVATEPSFSSKNILTEK
eukprot:gene13653-15082_t